MNMCFQLAYADMESYSDLEMVIFSSLLSFVWEHVWLCTDVCSFAIWYTHSVNVDPSLSFVWEHMCLCTVVFFLSLCTFCDWRPHCALITGVVHRHLMLTWELTWSKWLVKRWLPARCMKWEATSESRDGLRTLSANFCLTKDFKLWCVEKSVRHAVSKEDNVNAGRICPKTKQKTKWEDSVGKTVFPRDIIREVCFIPSVHWQHL